MAIQRWDPRRDLVDLQKRMNQLFDGALARSVGPDGGAVATEGWKPPVDLFENGEHYVLRADLAGVAAADVNIRIDDGTLHLRGERKADQNVARESYLRVERPTGRFAVEVSLPPSVDQKAIRASHKNGVIEILLPKKKEQTPSQIQVSPK